MTQTTVMINDNTIVEDSVKPLLDRMFSPKDSIGGERIMKKRTYNPLNTQVDDILSLSRLKEIQEEYGNVKVGNNIAGNDNRFCFSKGEHPELKNIANYLSEQTGNEWLPSGLFWYPANGYCGWHTNSNRLGARIYYAWADRDNESFFRYYDADKDEVVTQWDKKGINVRQFTVSKEKPCWHCVGSYANRISFGFMQKCP